MLESLNFMLLAQVEQQLPSDVREKFNRLIHYPEILERLHQYLSRVWESTLKHENYDAERAVCLLIRKMSHH